MDVLSLKPGDKFDWVDLPDKWGHSLADGVRKMAQSQQTKPQGLISDLQQWGFFIVNPCTLDACELAYRTGDVHMFKVHFTDAVGQRVAQWVNEEGMSKVFEMRLCQNST